jgi:hypothetical protein
METSYELGELLFEDKSIAKIECSIWCLADSSKKLTVTEPVIGEFDIDVSLKNVETDNNDKENQSNSPSIMRIETFYKKMQSESIVDPNGTTKTKFVYDYDKLRS